MNEWISVAVQVALLGVLVFVLERWLLRRMPAGWRELLWGGVLLRLLLPAQWFAVPGVAMPVWLAGTDAAGAAMTAPSPEPSFGIATGLAMVWGLGALFVAVRLRRCDRAEVRTLRAGSRWADREWHRAAIRAARSLRLRRLPDLLETSAVAAPCVVGVRHPVVFVPPATAPALADMDREHVLLHEFAHIARQDVLRALSVAVFRIVFWWHPIVWLAASRLALARELAADAHAAAGAPGGALAYGDTLLRWNAPTRAPQLGAVGWSPRSQLGARIEALARPFGVGAMAVGPRSRLALAGVLVVVGVSTPLALASPAHRVMQAAPGIVGRLFPVPPDLPPDVRDLPGCMQRRLLVLAQLAAEEQQGSR